MKIYPYNSGSESAKNLSEATGFKRLKRQGSTWVPKDGDRVINWGSSSAPDHLVPIMLNPPFAVAYAGCKLQYLGLMTTMGLKEFLPDWTDEIEDAQKWLSDGHTVVCRTKTTGHSGDGIVIAEEASEVVSAPLYTKYFKKDSEFRVHIVQDEVIDVQQKKRKMSVPDDEVDWRVRNLNGGFIYARENLTVPDKVLESALMVHRYDPLDFGAYDICYNKQKDKAIVLEVNTAPGISGTTVEKYANRFKQLLETQN